MSNPWAKVGGKDFDGEKDAKAQAEAIEDLKGGESGDPTFLRPQQGLNVYLVMPSKDNKFTSPFRDFLYHWGPNHACLRKDPVRIPGNQYEEDKRFSGCPRCLGAWEAWSGMDKPRDPHPQFAKFKYDMSNHSGLMQAIDITPFFKWDNPKDPHSAEPDKKAISEHYAAWVEYMTAYRRYVLGEVETAPAAPEGMPDAMVASAKAGLTFILLNKGQVQGCQDAFKDCYLDNGKESPLNEPDKFLLQINRTEDKSKAIPGSTKFATASSCKFIKVRSKDWTMSQITPLVEYVGMANFRNLYDPELLNPEKNTVADKIGGFKHITPEDLVEYLAERGFSYIAKDVDEDEDDEDDAPSAPSGPRPKARTKDVPTLDEDGEAKVAKLREDLFK